jgi:hypothetical protein
MSICAPCQVPHTGEDCEDTLAGRSGLARSCFCQHKPYSAAVPRQSAGSGEGAPGPGCDPPESHTDTTVAGVGEETAHQQGKGNTMSSSTFSRAKVDQGNWGRRG